ncbi:two-component response regulator ORR25-like isoform X2 [Apium graveolens]|uniref:two-component response regulator ORR25-like isoform X2 n=1 Tax=Apium graveolens TaxID=4045 RepID=UPI003D7AC98F
MPHMNGIELQRQINREFCLPVILISSDSTPELMYNGIQSGAQYFLLKPIVAEDLKNIWMFSVWWKRNSINRTSQENADGHNAFSSNNILIARGAKRFVWTHRLHTQFVEALLVLGYHEAVPKTIMEFMKVPELSREQVASHLQKYRQFINRVLDGSADLETSHWIDVNCYSSFVSGNPHLMLIDQLRSEKRNGNLVASYRSGGAKNYMFNSANHIGTSGTAPCHNNSYSIQALNMGGQGKDSIFTGHNISQAFNMAGQGSNGIFNGHDINGGQLLGVGQMTNSIFFNGHNINGGQFGNASTVNGYQLGAGQMSVPNLFKRHNIDGGQQLGAGGLTDKQCWFNNNEGKDGEDYWEDVIINVDIADDKDVGVADEFGDDIDDDDENSVDSDDDADYDPKKDR